MQKCNRMQKCNAVSAPRRYPVFTVLVKVRETDYACADGVALATRAMNLHDTPGSDLT